jgi:hypothetical protein
MSLDPNIDDRMTVNGYVRCGGCGGYLPAGAICGYCLDQQRAAASQRAAAQPRPAKPLRALLSIAFFAAIACDVGFAALTALKGVAKHAAPLSGSSAALQKLTGLSTGSDGSSLNSLTSRGNPDVMAALSSGNSQQALSLMQATGSNSAPTMQTAPPTQPPPTMQAQSAPATPILESAKGMPDDVRNWLEHLHRTEDTRIALAATQLQDAVKTLVGLQAGDITHGLDDEDNSSQEAEKKKHDERAQGVGNNIGNMQQAWKTLLSAFDSVPTPAECVAAKRNYDQVISQTGSMIMDIVAQIRASTKDPQAAVSALTAMQGKSKSQIDVPARATDQNVATICRRYDVTKWFDIQGDVGGGSMSQLGF